MVQRAPKSQWSEAELDVLRYLLLIYGYRGLNYRRMARLFENRTPADVKRRVMCIRDLARRKERRALAVLRKEHDAHEEPQSPTSVLFTLLPPEGRLHPEVVWVPATMEDIGRLNL